MTPRRCAAATASLFGAVWGCGASTEPTAARHRRLARHGLQRRRLSPCDRRRRRSGPAYRFDTMAAPPRARGRRVLGDADARRERADAGRRRSDHARRGDVAVDRRADAAMLPAGIPRRRLRRRRHRSARPAHGSCPAAFTSLGPDEQPPDRHASQAPAPRHASSARGNDDHRHARRPTTAHGLLDVAGRDGLDGGGRRTSCSAPSPPVPPTQAPCQFPFTAPAPAERRATRRHRRARRPTPPGTPPRRRRRASGWCRARR